MQDKNVLIITGNIKLTSGLGRYSFAIVNELQNIGVDYTVLTEQGESSGDKNEKSLLCPKDSIFNVIKNIFNVRRELSNYDNIHALDCWPYGVYAYLGVLGTKKKLFINGVGTYSIPSGNLLKRFLMNMAYRRAEQIFCISHYTQDQILGHESSLKTEVVFMGTTKLPKLPLQEQEEYKKKYDLGSRHPILLTVGAIKSRKGQFDTVQAVHKLKNDYPNVLYLIVGSTDDGDYISKIEEYTKEHGLESNVEIISGVESDTELAYLYSLSDVFLLNSNNKGTHFEGFGLVILEAGQFGKPVIGSKDCGIEDVIQDGYNGYLTEQGNPQDIYEKLLLVLGEQYKMLSDNSREFVKKFRWEDTVSSYIKYYDVN